MKPIPAIAAILAGVIFLYACSKPAALVVGRNSVGPITVQTPFEVDAIVHLLPQYKASEAMSSALEPGARVIRVMDGDRTLLELYPSGDGKHVQSVLILSDIVRDDAGIHIGSYFRDIFPPSKPTGCMAGAMEKAGTHLLSAIGLQSHHLRTAGHASRARRPGAAAGNAAGLARDGHLVGWRRYIQKLNVY